MFTTIVTFQVFYFMDIAMGNTVLANSGRYVRHFDLGVWFIVQSLLFERLHIDHKPISNVAIHDPLISLIYLLDRDDFYVA
jgi:hypothetical protein